MTAEIEYDFENHLNKCRCCLRDFEEDDTLIKITPIVEIRFLELTQLDVRQFRRIKFEL